MDNNNFPGFEVAVSRASNAFVSFFLLILWVLSLAGCSTAAQISDPAALDDQALLDQFLLRAGSKQQCVVDAGPESGLYDEGLDPVERELAKRAERVARQLIDIAANADYAVGHRTVFLIQQLPVVESRHPLASLIARTVKSERVRSEAMGHLLRLDPEELKRILSGRKTDQMADAYYLARLGDESAFQVLAMKIRTLSLRDSGTVVVNFLRGTDSPYDITQLPQMLVVPFLIGFMRSCESRDLFWAADSCLGRLGVSSGSLPSPETMQDKELIKDAEFRRRYMKAVEDNWNRFPRKD